MMMINNELSVVLILKTMFTRVRHVLVTMTTMLFLQSWALDVAPFDFDIIFL